MWVCPKCGRELKRKNQGHYCGKAPVTAEEYIEMQPPKAQPHLKEIVHIIRISAADAEERILWGMPFYEKEGKSISFAACKNHISFYAGAEAIERFHDELSGFSTKKSAIYFPYEKKLPSALIADIVKWCLVSADS